MIEIDAARFWTASRIAESLRARGFATEFDIDSGPEAGGVPAILPVTYRVVDRNMVFVTGPGMKLDAVREQGVLAFEVDSIDESERAGWSVLVVGLAAELDETMRVFARRWTRGPAAIDPTLSAFRCMPSPASGSCRTSTDRNIGPDATR